MKTGRAAWAIVGIAAALSWPGGPGARADAPSGPPLAAATAAPTVETPESLQLVQDPSLRLTLSVKINGKGPFDFLVDTGSDRTVISRELAETLALPPGPKVLIHESTGTDEAQTVVIDHLTIGNRVIDHVEAPALAAKDLGGAGMLGVDALRDLHVVMDFKAMRMSSSPSRPEVVDRNTIVVRGRNRLGQLILVHSRIHGVPILVVVDSGAQLSVGNPALLKLLNRRSVSQTPAVSTKIISVTGRTLTIELDPIAEADVGGVVIRNMSLGFAPLPIFDRFGLGDTPALLLGMDVLSHCRRVSVDLRRREATFTLN